MASAVSLLMLFFFLKPHWALQRAAAKGASAKFNVDSHRLRWNRRDTIGLTAKAIDTLIARLHYVRESELAPWKHAFSKTGLPILKFNPNGRLSEANDAAAKLFEKEHPTKLKELSFVFTTIPDNKQGSPLDISQEQKDGHFQGQITLQTARGNVKVCFADITRMDSSELRKSAGVQVVLVDATDFFTRLVMKEEEASRLAAAGRESKRADLLMRRQLEAFAFLAEPPKKDTSTDEQAAAFISMERLINEWYQESLSGGASEDVLEHSALEAVSGDPDTVRNVVRQAYSMMYTLSGEVKPQITISSKLVRGGMAEFIIEQVPDLDGKKTPLPDEILSWSHNFDALKKALDQANGQLLYFDATVRPINLIFRLPAFRNANAKANPNGNTTPISSEEYDELKRAS
ncbi:MAG: PAS domain-containing protein [Hyphomicrobiales bacterium]